MRDKNSIVRDIVRDCPILHQTKYYFGLALLIKANIEFFFSYLHHQIPPVMVNLLLDFTSAAFHLIA